MALYPTNIWYQTHEKDEDVCCLTEPTLLKEMQVNPRFS